jgi:polyisoprenoid-binding protein YceI
MSARIFLLAGAFFAMSACVQLAAPLLKPAISTDASKLEAGNWTLDETHASLVFKISHLGYSNYVGRFEKFTADLKGDPAGAEAAEIAAAIDMTSLDLANDTFAETLMGPDWFDAAQYPTATFRSNAVKRTGDNTAAVSGLLTLHGRTAPVSLDVTFNGGAYDPLRKSQVMGFSARGKIRRSDFGVSKYSGLITDEVAIEIEAEFLKR